MTHADQIKKTKPARPCTAHDAAIGGGCFNCLYDPEHIADAAQPQPVTLKTADTTKEN